MNMRDPLMYRIYKATHHRTGDTWPIYPMYDWAHGLEDSIEGVTHSICTLEFEHHRPLYDWFLDQLDVHHPQQIEFNQLNLTYTVMSKRKLLELVERGVVSGWDDPRMPTLAGMRRRGFSPQAIRQFLPRNRRQQSEQHQRFQPALEFHLRQDLNATAPRHMGVLNPVKVVVTNFNSDDEFMCEALINPEQPELGTVAIPFTGEFYIERDDFMIDPPRKFFRLAPGREVRLRYACLFTATEAITDADGNITEIHGTWDPESKGGSTPDNRKVKSTIHWISSTNHAEATVNLYDHLFTQEKSLAVDEGVDWVEQLNPSSLTALSSCKIPQQLANKPAATPSNSNAWATSPSTPAARQNTHHQPHRRPA